MIELRLLKDGLEAGDDFERLLLLPERTAVRIDEPFLRDVDELEHELFVEHLAEVFVERLHVHVGQRLPREGEIIAHRKEIGLFERDGLGKDLAHLAEGSEDVFVGEGKGFCLLADDGRDELLRMMGKGHADERFEPERFRLELFRTIVDDIARHRIFGEADDLAGVGDECLRRVLFDLERKVVDVLDGIGGSLAGAVVSVFELEVLDLKLVEVAALLGVAGGGLLAECLVHAVVEALERRVEADARLLLAELALDEHGLGHLLAHTHDGVERGEWILEDHGDFVAADLVEVLFGDLHEILAVIDDLTALFDGVGGEDAEDGARRDRLARTRLTHDGERFALIELEADIADGLDLAVGRPEGDLEVVDLEFDFSVFHISPPSLSAKG